MEKMLPTCFEYESMRGDNLYRPITIIKILSINLTCSCNLLIKYVSLHFQSHNIVSLIRYVSQVFTFNLMYY